MLNAERPRECPRPSGGSFHSFYLDSGQEASCSTSMRTIYHSILIYLLISQLLFIIIWNSTSNHVTKLSNNLSTIACNTDPLYSMPTACEGGAQLFASSLQQKSMPLRPKYGPYKENYAVADKNLSLRGRRQISRPKYCPRDKSLSSCSQNLALTTKASLPSAVMPSE